MVRFLAVSAAALLLIATSAAAQTASPAADAFINLCVEGKGDFAHAAGRAEGEGWNALPDGLIPDLGIPFKNRQAWINADAANPIVVIAGDFDMPANDAAIHMNTCAMVAQPVDRSRAITPDPHAAFASWFGAEPDPRFTNAEQTAFAFLTEGDERRNLNGLSDMAVAQAVAAGRVTIVTLAGRGVDRVMFYVAPSL